MAYTTLNLGLTLTIPTNGTKNWGTIVKNTTWTKISQHGHTGSGDGTKISTAALADNIKIKHFAGTQAATLSPAGTTQTIDFNNGNTQALDVSGASGDVTVTLSNPVSGATYRIYIIQGATPRDVVWPASVKWPQGVKAILSTSNGAIDKVELYYNGSVYLCDWDLDYK